MRVLDNSGNTKNTNNSTIARSDYAYRHAGGSGIEVWYCAMCDNATALSTVAITVNQLRAVPFIAPARGGTLDRLGFNVTTLAAGNARIGLYNNTSDSNLYPSSLIVDSGLISTGTTGVKTATISVNLTPGQLYWIALATDAAPSLRALVVGNINANILGHANTFGTAPNAQLSVNLAFAALPSTFTAGATLSTVVPPALYYRFSA